LRRGNQLANTLQDFTGHYEIIVQGFYLSGQRTGCM
jgi:hypothetical protein